MLAILSLVPGHGAPRSPSFRIEETTIARVHAAMKAQQLTCRALVQQYLERIEANDRPAPR